MLIRLQQVLRSDDLKIITGWYADARFVEGRSSAGRVASQVKKNSEMFLDKAQQIVLNKTIMQSLGRHAIFRSAALPRQIADPILVRYTQGDAYGSHIDDPVIGAGCMRADIACTLFLNEPSFYEGGQLQIRTTFGPQECKLNAGDAVLYPASSRHQVAKVESGERWVAVTWIQSMIRDAAQRELLFELDQARESLHRRAPGEEVTARVDQSYTNLLRMWAEV